MFHKLLLEGAAELWIAFGTGKSLRYLAVHVSVFHASTGCDQFLSLLLKERLRHGKYGMHTTMPQQPLQLSMQLSSKMSQKVCLFWNESFSAV